MNTKLIVLLGGVGAVHLVAGALFLAGGCAQEDPPMPPGIYVPKQSAQDAAAPAPAPAEPGPAGQADFSSPMPAEPAPQASPAPYEPAPQPKSHSAARTESRGEKVYIVVKNDSLWLIARKHGLTIEELADYNSLSPKAKLQVGQKLYIPPTGKKGARNAAPHAKAKAKSKTKAKPAPAKKGKKSAHPAGKSSKASAQLPPDGIYTVKEYDNFSTIAKRFGIKVSDIIAANPGVDSSRLKIGQKLRLTSDAAAVPKAKAAPKKAKNAKAAKAAKPAAKSAKSAKSAKPAAKPEKQAAEPAPAAEQAAPAPAESAPADEKKAEASTPDDPESLLNTVKQPQDTAAPEKKPESAPAAPPQASAGQDKDRLIQGKNGKLTVVLGEDTSLTKFCKKFTVSEHVIRSQNQNLPSDGRLKAGTSILLIAEEDDLI